MSEEVKEAMKTKKREEHVALSELASAKITNWTQQVNAKKKGVRITRKDFVNWLIEKSPELLGSGDLNSLIERFYDEATFLRQLLRDVKTRREAGEIDPGFELVVKAKRQEVKRETQSSESQQSTEESARSEQIESD